MRRCMVIAALAAVGCSGSIDPAARSGPGGAVGPGGGGGPGVSPPPGPGGGPGPASPPPAGVMPPDRTSAACKTISPGASPVRRLNRHEYASTVRDLLGDTGVTIELPAEERALGFDNGAESRSVSDLLAGRYFTLAEQLAAAAVTRLDRLVACDPARDGEATCFDRLLDGFGKRAWRRPLEPGERQNLRRAFDEGKAGATGAAVFADGVGAVVAVMLQAPQFLYRVERGVAVPGQAHQRLSPWEVASRLSYLLWGSMPDEALFAAAEAGRLSTPEQVRVEAQRLLADPRAAHMVSLFADQWLRLEELGELVKEPLAYPTFTPELRAPMHQETRALVDEVMWRGDGKIATLLTAPYTFVNGPLAQYYGWTGVSGAAFQKVDLPAGQRLGLLTHAGVLSVTGVPDGSLTSLVFRGLYVRERLLCQHIPDPPAGAADMNPPFTPETTAREWSEARQAVALCGACHKQMDPIGLGFESFDGAGRWRDRDRNKPIDARGLLEGTDVDGAFDGPVELARRLAGSRQVEGCVATQLFRYGYGRQETAGDDCTMDTLRGAMRASGGDLRALLLALTQTDAFLYKGAVP
jgi:hypothetical protein